MVSLVTRALSGVRSVFALDLLFYAVLAADAGYTALFSEFYGFRIWGNFAVVGYSLAALHSAASLLRLRSRPAADRDGREPSRVWSRWVGVGTVGLFAVLAPLVALVARRVGGRDWGSRAPSMTAQPEVWVIERSAELLVRTGSPYVDLGALGRPAVVDDYGPYGPTMAVFGLPRALLGPSALTDSRLMFALGTVLVLALAWQLAGRPSVPVRAVQLVCLTTWATLHAAVAGNDLPVVALLVLAAVLVDRPGWAAVVVAVAVGMKLTALPMVVVLAVAVTATQGARALGRYLGAFVLTGVIVMLPVLLVRPGSFVDHVIRFPANLGQVRSPAGSPLPGHLLVENVPGGHTIVLALFVAAAAAICAWLWLKPPRTATDVLLRTAVSLAVAMLLMPATRWGYLLYPVALFGAAHGLHRLFSSPGTCSWPTRRRAVPRPGTEYAQVG